MKKLIIILAALLLTATGYCQCYSDGVKVPCPIKKGDWVETTQKYTAKFDSFKYFRGKVLLINTNGTATVDMGCGNKMLNIFWLQKIAEYCVGPEFKYFSSECYTTTTTTIKECCRGWYYQKRGERAFILGEIYDCGWSDKCK